MTVSQEVPPGGQSVERMEREVEAHSIDVIPDDERYGTVRSQFFLWFSTNASAINFVIGGFAIGFGLNFFWAIVALIVGTVLGAIFVALHAIQGPRLGVPQMIQSRGQFGFYGAVLVFAASIVLDFGFLAAQLVIQADAMNLLAGSVTVPEWIAILTVPVIVRTTSQMETITGSSPYGEVEGDPRLFHVTFLAETPGGESLKKLAGPPDRFGDDEFKVVGQDVYLYVPGGYGETKLNNSFFEKRLGVVATTRNWRSVTALAEMAGVATP